MAFLTTQAYWAPVARRRGHQGARSPRPGGWWALTTGPGAMVGFARAFGDGGCGLPGRRVRAARAPRRRAGQGHRADDDRGRPGRRLALDAAHLRRARPVPAVRLRPPNEPLPGAPAASRSRDTAAGCRAVAGTLAGKAVRLEPLGHQHVPGLVAAAAGGAELYRWSAVPQDEARSASTSRRRSRPGTAGTAVPFAVVRAADDTVIGSTRFFDFGLLGLAGRPRPHRPGHLRDRLHLARPERRSGPARTPR